MSMPPGTGVLGSGDTAYQPQTDLICNSIFSVNGIKYKLLVLLKITRFTQV